MAKVRAVQSYLVHFRDRQLALAVGAGLEDRLARDGHDAVALVSRADGAGLTRADGTGRRASRGSYRDAPQVVALYEEGLLAKLESLGLTAYVGVHPDEEPGTIRWSNGGAMLLPVTTARELIDAVATHTPWVTHAAKLTKRTFAMPTVLPRNLAVAGVVGPMLLAGLPGAAAAATAPHHPSVKTGGITTTAFDATMAPQAAQSPAPSSNQVFLNRIDSAIRFYLAQTRQQLANNDNATQALENQILRLVNAFINGQGGASSPGAGASPGGRQAGSPGGQAGGQQSPGGQAGGQQSPSGQGGSQQSPGGQQGGGKQGGGGGGKQGGGGKSGGGKGGGQGKNQSQSQSQNPSASQSQSQSQNPSASQSQSPSMSGQQGYGSGQQGYGSGQGTTGSGGGTSAYGSGGGPSSSGGNSSGGNSSGGGSSGGGSSS
jgi:hypothetical protein